jgi:hypothetical protein
LIAAKPLADAILQERLAMSDTPDFPSDVAFTPAVKAVQARKGSREAYARVEQGAGWRTEVDPDLAAFLGTVDSFFLATASAEGQPYIFVMDYAHRRRVKIWGEARVVDDDPALLTSLMPAGYKAKPEQVILFKISAWDTNCPQHIPQKFDAADVAAALAARDARIAELEAKLASKTAVSGASRSR